MVKFFLKNQKHPPKSHLFGKNNQISKSKPKKVLDYRIVIWKKLFNLIKTQHSLILQKIIRKIKQTKQKIQLRQTQSMSQVDNQAQTSYLKNQAKTSQVENQPKINQLKKDLMSLDAKYQSMKSIKKPQLKHITLYIILEVLKIQNIEKIVEKAKLEKQLQTSKLKQQLQNNETAKKFIEKLSLLTVYQKELEVCAQLVDLVQEKKLQRKTKLKERKERKYEREQTAKKQLKEGESEDEKSQKQNNGEDDKAISSNQEVIEEQTQKKKIRQVIQKFQKNQNKNHQKKIDHQKNIGYQKNKHQLHKPNKPFAEKPNYSKSTYAKQKPIHRQRTQFRKTGRNKVKYQKQQKKLHFKNKAKQQQTNTSQQKIPKKHGQFAFSKDQAHPSWKAKQQLKQEVYIQPFQGKKILL